MEELPLAEGGVQVARTSIAPRYAAHRHRSHDMTRPPATPYLTGLASADQLGAVVTCAALDTPSGSPTDLNRYCF